MDIQRLRNLTTGYLHTEMGHIYEDIDRIVGAGGVMTHQLGNACRSMEPYLKAKAPDPRLWEQKYDPDHVGDIDVPTMGESERDEFFARFAELPSPLAGREPGSVVVATD